MTFCSCKTQVELCRLFTSGCHSAQLVVHIHWPLLSPATSVCDRAVCRAVSKLHEATSGVLTAEHSRRLFARMNTAFVDSLRRRVARLNIKSDGGPQHGSVAAAGRTGG